MLVRFHTNDLSIGLCAGGRLWPTRHLQYWILESYPVDKHLTNERQQQLFEWF